LTFDLRTDSDRSAWERFVSGRGWSDSVTALSVLMHKVNHTLPVPRENGFKAQRLGAGVLFRGSKVSAEKVFYEINGIQVCLVVYNGTNKVTRLEVNQATG